MSKATWTDDKFNGPREWKRVLLYLGIACLLLCCPLGTVCYWIWGLPGTSDIHEAANRNRNDISNLSEAVVSFETRFSVDYLPSRIRLLDNGAYDLTLNEDGRPNNQVD
jgi:hypothetical protein